MRDVLARLWRVLVAWRQLVLGLLCVVLPSPLLFIPYRNAAPQVPRAAFVLGLMSLFWALCPISIYVTALFPLFLLPVLGLMNANATAAAYWNDAILMFFGSFVLTCAMERWHLHKRLALRIVLLMGDRPRLILLGIMGATAFLSMWMSNTATAALMVPLVLPIVRQLNAVSDDAEARQGDVDMSTDREDALLSMESVVDGAASATRGDAQRKAAALYSKSLLLTVAYSASLGGVSTLIGTGPNLVLVQMLATLYPTYPGLSFGAWMLFAVPLVVVALGSLWAYFVFVFNRRTIHLVRFDVAHYMAEYAAMGRITMEEVTIMAVTGTMALLWLTRTGIPPSVPGWGSFFGGYVQDGTVCVALSTLLFVIPSRKQPGSTILEVASIRDLHWDVILLLGAGFAIASAFVSSGLTAYIGQLLGGLRAVPTVVVVLVVATVASFWTEVCSNVATANILLPLVGALAVAIGQNPLLLMVPTTVACSLAFMLPVGTPPNAMVMAAGVLRPWDMIRVGFFLNVLGVLCVTGWMLVGGRVLGVQLGYVPTWASAGAG